TAVNFGSTAAVVFTVLSDTAITATAPAATAASTVDITVTTFSGTSATGSADHFTYSAPALPSVTSITPTSGSTAGGTVLLVSGSGFSAASSVLFGSTPAASFTVYSDSLISAVSPTDAAGTLDITVTTPAGTSAAISADRFTFSAAPTPMVNAV